MLDAAVAQSVEQRIRNAKVGSSIPPSGTKKPYKSANYKRPPLSGFFVFGCRGTAGTVESPKLANQEVRDPDFRRADLKRGNI